MDDNIIPLVEKNQKGKPTLLYEGYRYNRNSRKNQNRTILWRCVKRLSCSASITTDKTVSQILRQSGHSCESRPIENRVFVMMNKTKKDVCKSLGSIQQIFEDNFSELKDDDEDLIPIFPGKRDTLYRTIKKYLNTKKLVFNTVDEVYIPAALSNGFVVSDVNAHKDVIVFATNLSLSFMKSQQSGTYFGDATFQCVPIPYYQLYTIHLDIDSNDNSTNVVPVIFALMANKEQNSYIRLFSIVKRLGINLSSFKCDYEVAQLNAYQTVFPNGNLSGCYHHYNAAIFKKSKSLKANLTGEERMVVRKTAILPLLPGYLIPEVWFRIIDSAPNNPRMQAFKRYFERTWYPHLKPSIISCAHERHRTTNAVEGWHRRLQVKIPKKISLLFFIYKLRKEAKYSDGKIRKSFFEQPKRNRRNRDVLFDVKYKKYLEQLEINQITPCEFLMKMIYCRLAL